MIHDISGNSTSTFTGNPRLVVWYAQTSLCAVATQVLETTTLAQSGITEGRNMQDKQL